jgi:5S rRNA maturation endonuclease (ribonuclease M5)
VLSFKELNDISSQVMGCLEDFFQFFDLDLKDRGNCYSGCCPVHKDSDNPNAFVYYKESGIWQCNTHGCHNVFKKTPIGLIRGLLSRNKTGWEKSGDNMFTFPATIAFIEQFLKKRPKSPLNNPNRHVFKPKVHKEQKLLNIGISSYVSQHNIPSQYFLNRGFSKVVLNKFMVGDYKGTKTRWQNRVTVPVLNNQMTRIVGFTSRTIFDKCLMCSGFHPKIESCPDRNPYSFIKWQHNDHFAKHSLLYNYWNVSATKNDTVILVEGPADVWKLEMAGYQNGLAIFGSNLMESQAKMILDLNPRKIITIMDNDEAGEDAERDCRKKLEPFCEVISLVPTKKDLGEMSIEEIKDLI